MVKHPCKDILKTRKATGLTQLQFWSRVGLRQCTGSRLEREERDMSLPIQMLIEIAYGTGGDMVIAKLRGLA